MSTIGYLPAASSDRSNPVRSQRLPPRAQCKSVRLRCMTARRRKSSREIFDRTRCAQHKCTLLRVQGGEASQDHRSALFGVTEDPADESQREPLMASGSHRRARATTIVDTSADHSPQTQPPWQVEKNHGVAGGESAFQCAAKLPLMIRRSVVTNGLTRAIHSSFAGSIQPARQ